MDDMEVDPPLPTVSEPPSPLDRLRQRLGRFGIGEEYLGMGPPGLVAFVKDSDSWERLSELVEAVLPSDGDVRELMHRSRGESKKVANAAVGLYFRDSMNWLQFVMFMGDPSAALKRLSKLSMGRGVCGVVWGNNDIAYRCRTCEFDPTCAICVPCFMNGDHKDHDYSIIYTGGGCCDCGDVTAWKREGFCSKHKGAEQIKPLPEEFANSVGPVLDALLSIWKDKLMCIETIEMEKFWANELVAAGVKAANKLTVAVVEMVLQFCKYSESLLSFVSKRVVSLDGLLKVLVRAEGFLSESVVKKLQEMLLKLLGEPNFKYEFAKAFLGYYPFVVQEVTKEGSDEAMKKYPLLSKFSVQILTVPTLTPQLVKEEDLLSMLLGCLENIFVHCAGHDGYLLVSKWGNLNEITIRVVEDIRFVLSHGVISKYVNHERKDILKTWMNLLGFLQGMSPLKRETGIHIEEEDEHMNLPFVLGHSIANIHGLLVEGAFSSGKESEDTLLHVFTAESDEGDSTRLSKVGRLSQESPLCGGLGRNTACVSASSPSGGHSGSSYDLLPLPVKWLACECLRAIDNWLEPDNTSYDVPSHISGSIPNKNFLSFKGTLSMLRNGKYIFGGLSSPSEDEFLQCVDPLKMENSNNTEDSKMHMKVVDYRMGGGTSGESNILHRLSLSDWPHIAYDVSLQEISVHIPLHRFLSMLIQKALRRCFGESMTSTDASILSSAVPDDFFGLLLDGCHPTGFSAFVMEHPLRNRVFFAEVHAGMWRKNGDAAIMSCEWYRSVRWAEQGLEHDLFLLQCCGALAPANDYVRRIVERFGLLDHLSMNSECSNEYEPVLVQEMLVLLIQIVQERRFSGLTTAESLRRELVHKLAVGDATRSQLVKSLPRDLSKFDQLQEILDSVATYSTPSGFNQGTYSLRSTCWKELDLYFPRWNSRDLQVAEERFMRFFSSSALTSQLPRWTKVFMPLRGIANIATCEAALQIVRSVLFYAVYSKTKAHTPDGVLLSALHLLYLALDICFQQRESGSSAMCIGDIKAVLAFATEEIRETRHHFKGDESLLSLLVSLMKMQTRGREFVEVGSCDFNSLIENVLKKLAELDSGCTRKLQQLAPGVVVHIPEPILGDSESMEISGSDTEKRKAKARERQAAILAKMKAEQTKFLSSMNSTSDHISSDVGESNSDEEQLSEDSLDDVCCLCHDQNSRSPISFLVLLLKSRLLSFTEKVPPSWDQLPWSEKEQRAATKKSTDKPGPVITSGAPGEASSSFITQSDQTSTNVLSHHEEFRDGGISNEMVEQDVYLSIWKEVNENFQVPSSVVRKDEMSTALAGEERSKSSEYLLLKKFVAAVEREAPENPSASSAFNNEVQTDGHSQNATAHDGFSPADCDGVYLSSCGHAVHQQCLDRYLSSLRERYVRRIAFEGGHIVNPDQGEFLCPVCRRLANSVLPGALKGWKQPIISTVSSSQSEKGVSPVPATSDIEDSSIFFRTGLALLQSASNTIDKGNFLKTYHPQDKKMKPDLDSICRVLSKKYFLNSQDKLSGLSMVNFSMIMWDVLKYSLASLEIAARGGRANLEATCSNDTLYQELKSSTGFALALLLKCAERLRSYNAAHVLQRFQGIQLFANSICSGFQIHGDLPFSLKSVDKGGYLDSQFWNRSADPILAHDAFSSFMWVLFCLPLPFLSCQDSFLPLVHVLYAVTVVQAILACPREHDSLKADLGFEDNLIVDVSKVSGDFEWLQPYSLSAYIDRSCDVRDAIRRLTFPFLRRCALLWKVLSTSISAPFSTRDPPSSIDGVDDLHEIEELERLFKIPQLNSFIRDPQLRSLAMRWLHHLEADNKVCLSNCSLPITPAVPFKLICLPTLYQDLMQRFIKQRCGDCNNVVDEPALCLLCGNLCSPNWKSCCRENGCQSHAMACGAGTGVFLLIKRTTILLLRCARQSPWPSLYLDAYGEEDIEMHRGKPLYLNTERYAALTYMVASHALDRSSKVLGRTTIGFLI